ncbi:MAG: AraC family transcriptional regulator [Bacteroidaceae bacterium]|nr:AraC family transcriptional regulator [Bacteroidaceae bacterium]
MCLSLYQTIDATIRHEKLYAVPNLMREDIMHRFSIGRHRLNALLTKFADGKSFPQYINEIRIREAHLLLTTQYSLSISDVAQKVGLSPSNLRELWKQRYGMTPTDFRRISKHK